MMISIERSKFIKRILVTTMIIISIFYYIPITSFAEDNKRSSSSDNRFSALIPAFANSIISKFAYTDIYTNNNKNNSNSGSDVITNYSDTGDGWDSITTVTYPNGTKRTFRNYKQYQGSYSTKQFWNGTIHSSACGPSALAIILSGYQIDADPGKVVDSFHALDYDYTSIDILQTVLKKKYNIDSEIEDISSSTTQHIRENFRAGRPIIAGVYNHFVTYLGEDSNGDLILSDAGYSDRTYGKTVEDYVNNYSGYQVLLIKSDGNAKQSSSNNTSNNKSTNTKASSNNNGDYDIQKCDISNGAYNAIFTSGTTGRQFKEFKQDADYNYPYIGNGCSWISECGTVATGIVGSGYKNLTMQDLADKLNNNGGSTYIDGFLSDFSGQQVQRSSISSVNDLVNALSKGSVAVIHACGYSENGHYLAALDISKDKSKIYISNPDIYGGNGIQQGWNSINTVWDALCEDNPNPQKTGIYHQGKDEIYFVTNDGSPVDYTGEGISRSNTLTEDKIFYIGDSWMVGLKGSGKAKSQSSYFYAEGGMNADWVIRTYSDMKIPNDASCIVVEFGLNNLSSVGWNNTQKLINKLKEDYSEKEIFVLQTPHICDGYTFDPNFNSKVDDYNKNMREYCENKEGVTYINPTTNIVSNQGSGYLRDEYAADAKDTSQGGGKIHLNIEGYKVWYDDIIKCIKKNIKLENVKPEIDMSKNIIERQEGTDKKGYKINIDLNAEIDNFLYQLYERGYHLENYLSTKNQKKYLKNMIKATIVTQYPDLRNAEDIANNSPIDDNEVQGCIRIKRYADGETKAFAAGNLKNPIDNQDEKKGMYLSYMPYKLFMEKISNSEVDALNYFTMDSSNNLVVAGWETMDVVVDGPHQTNVGEIQGNVKIGDAPSNCREQYVPKQQPYAKLTTKNINYLSQVSNYTMPFSLMWSLLVYGHNEDFVNDIAKLVIDTKIVIGCVDATNVRVTEIPQSYSVNWTANINYNLNDEQRQAFEHATTQSELPKQEVKYKFSVTEKDTLKTDTPTLAVMYANTWTAIYKKNYEIKKDTKNENGETVNLDDVQLDSDILIRMGMRYLANRQPGNDLLKDKIETIIDSETDRILKERIEELSEEADKENSKIEYKYKALQEKIQEHFKGTDLEKFLSIKDVQSNLIKMITNKFSKDNVKKVFSDENDLMVKYAKDVSNSNDISILDHATNAVADILIPDEDLYNQITKNGKDYTLPVTYTTTIESIVIEIKKIKADQKETINQETTTSTVVELPDGVTWKTDKNSKENSFVKILSKNPEAKTNLHGVSGWFFESMENTAAIADLEDLIKMLFQFVYSDFDYGINPDDLKSLFDPEKMQSIGGTSQQPGNIGTSKLSDFLKVWENGAMRRYQNGEITDYNSSPYIYMCITQDKKEYIMCDDLFTGNNNRNYGYGICFYTGYDNQFLNTGYFKDEGIDITDAKYQNYGSSTLPVEIVDRIKERIIEDQRENARYLAKSVGVDLKDYQIDAIAACSYQGWQMYDFLQAYKDYGMTESIRYYSSGMKPGDSRYEANWKLFSTGKYTDEYGNELT